MSSLDEQIAQATSAGDWARVDVLNAQKFAGLNVDHNGRVIDPEPPPTPAPNEGAASATLDEQITEATRAGDWERADLLNARKLADLNVDHNGTPRPRESAPDPPPAPDDGVPEAPVGGLDGGARDMRRGDPLDAQIHHAAAAGDWQALDRLNTQKLAEAAARQRAADLS